MNAEESLRQRREMIAQQIEARGVHDPRVLRAVEAVPREHFLSPDQAGFAYDDRALAIEESQTISQPFIVAFMTQALQVASGSRVLEIGTGSGYQTAVLTHLAGHVYSVERFSSLLGKGAERVRALGAGNVSFCVGDGSLGWPEHSPYDRIIVTAASPEIPEPLLDQLGAGGRMVLPVGDESQQTLLLVRRDGPRVVETPLIPCRFVKLVGHAGWR